MKLAAVAVSVVALGGAGAHSRVLAFDYDARQLAWFDPQTLVRRAPSTAYQTSVCSWSYSPDRRHVAVSNCQGAMRFLAVPSLKGEGRLTWTSRLGNASAVTWLRPDRLVAVSTLGPDLSTLVLIDPTRRKVLKRLDLNGVAGERHVVAGSVVLLVKPTGRFGPPQVLVVASDGSTRSITLGRFSVGTVTTEDANGTPHFESRTPGFAVDTAKARAYVVGRDLTVADVDLRSGDVSYHGPVRTLAKTYDGWTRIARLVPGGSLAVSGEDRETSGDSTSVMPFGLRLVDTGSWTGRVVDPRVSSFIGTADVLFTYHGSWSAYGVGGTWLYDLELDPHNWVSLQAGRGYVCDLRAAVAVIDVATGSRTSVKGRACPTFLTAPRSDN